MNGRGKRQKEMKENKPTVVVPGTTPAALVVESIRFPSPVSQRDPQERKVSETVVMPAGILAGFRASRHRLQSTTVPVIDDGITIGSRIESVSATVLESASSASPRDARRAQLEVDVAISSNENCVVGSFGENQVRRCFPKGPTSGSRGSGRRWRF